MNITIDLTHFRALLLEAGELAARKALIDAGYLKPFISFNEACELYGATDVQRWIDEGYIKRVRDGVGQSYRIDAHEIATVKKAHNRSFFIEVDDIKISYRSE